MKFYKRFPGDIGIKTGDLSLAEFGAYDRLLDHFYAKEQPIHPERVYTVARCQSAADRRAVDQVLAEFWELTDAGWVQQRAEEMIAEALPRIEAAKQNGKLGGRPKKPSGFSRETENETQHAELAKGSQSQNKSSSSKNTPKAPKGADVRFDEFWKAYPAKVGKDAARKAWDKRKPDAELLATMLAAIEAQRGSERWTKDGGQYIPNPATWLNQGRWEDEAPPAVTASVSTVPLRPTAVYVPPPPLTQQEREAADAARRVAMGSINRRAVA